MERDLLDRVLAGRAWREDVEAFSEATGVVVAVLPTTRSAEVRCPVCLLPSKRDGDSSPCLACFSEGSLGSSQGAVTAKCRGGVGCFLQPVGSCPGAYLLVGGYVTSEAERKELLARLLEQGVSEREARRVARATPVIRKQAAEALAHLGASHLDALLATEGEDSERALEYELLYEIGRGFDRFLGEFDKLAGDVLDRALRVTAADAGGLFLLGDDGRTLQPVVVRGESLFRPHGPIELGRGTVGHAARTGRSLLVSGFADRERKVRTTSLAVPLRAEEGPIGVLVLVAADTGRPLAGTDLKLMEFFAESATRALVNSRRYSAASDRVLELMQLNELSKALAADSELDRMVYLVTSVLDKVLDFEVGGLLLLGREEPARIVLRADVPADALGDLLAEVAGCELSDSVMHRCTIVHADGGLSKPSGEQAKWSVLAEDISTARPSAGYLFVASRQADAFDAADARLLRDQAAHASAALEKARAYARLQGDLEKLVSTLSAMADAAERTESGHAGRVMEHALAIGEDMGLPRERIEALRFAALLHDIGKLGVPEQIIVKPSRLTPDEMAEVRRHSEIGANLVDQMRFLDSVAPIVLHHHERWDGTGYPKGLAGEAIPLSARILAVADAFDAMTCNRTYSRAMPASAARIELQRGAGNQFDPEVVKVFLRILDGRTAGALKGLTAHARASRSAQLPS